MGKSYRLLTPGVGSGVRTTERVLESYRICGIVGHDIDQCGGITFGEDRLDRLSSGEDYFNLLSVLQAVVKLVKRMHLGTLNVK